MNLKFQSWGMIAVIGLLFCFGIQSGASNTRISVGDERVSFIPPPAFKPLTREQIVLKFPRINPPQYVFANEKQSVTAAVTFASANMAPDQLQEFKEAMEQMLPRMIPGLKWITRELVTINHRKWLHLEMTSYAIDTDIHNHLYATSFNGKALLFAFNSTVKEYPQAKAELARSAQSIQVRD